MNLKAEYNFSCSLVALKTNDLVHQVILLLFGSLSFT
jgi:hypothetical protein